MNSINSERISIGFDVPTRAICRLARYDVILTVGDVVGNSGYLTPDCNVYRCILTRGLSRGETDLQIRGGR